MIASSAAASERGKCTVRLPAPIVRLMSMSGNVSGFEKVKVFLEHMIMRVEGLNVREIDGRWLNSNSEIIIINSCVISVSIKELGMHVVC